MPYAVTHVLFAIIIVDLYRDYILKNHKKYLTLHTLLFAGIGGLLPDIDIPINWALNLFGYSFSFFAHGAMTHSILFGAVFLIPGFIFIRKNKHKAAFYFFVITFGVLSHLFLDFTLGGGMEGVMLLFPLSGEVFGLNLLGNMFFSLAAGIDAIILLLWLWHEEHKHKINDFI